MKSKQAKKETTNTWIEGDWIDVDDLVKPGESIEIAEGVGVTGLEMVVLDPPEPIKKPRVRKSPKRKK